jgi:HSP20 family protein
MASPKVSDNFTLWPLKNSLSTHIYLMRTGLIRCAIVARFNLKEYGVHLCFDLNERRNIMSLVKWDPFVELEDVSKHLDRIFRRAPAHLETNREVLTMVDWMPIVDITETDTTYLINVEIPGVSKEDVKVSIEDGMVTMRGERKQEKVAKDKKFHRIERSYGSFMRSFRLPEDVDEAGVKAEFKDGMINVTLPKSGKSKAKSIEVSIS